MQDADGFITVTARGKGRASAVGGGGKGAGDVLMDQAAPQEEAEATQPSQEGHGQDDGGHGHADAGEADQSADGSGDAVTADQLREAWARDCKVVEYLRQQGYADGDPVLVAAEAQVAASKQAWDGARPGVAVSKRLIWAEQALARAKRSQARLEQSIDELDAEYERERDQRMRQLHECRARTRQREANLATISRQAAAEFNEPGGTAEASSWTEVVQSLDGPIRDAIQEAHDQAPQGSPLRTRLLGALGTLSNVQGIMAGPPRRQWAHQFDMAWDDDDEANWYPEEGHAPADGDHWDHDDAGDGMDTRDVQAPHWVRTSAADDGDDRWGPPAWKRGRRWDHDGYGGVQGQHATAWGAPCDQTMGMGTQARHQDVQMAVAAAAAAPAPATAAGDTPAPPTPTAEEHALQQRRQAVWDQAQVEGVQIAAATIAAMAAEELEEWARAHLNQL